MKNRVKEFFSGRAETTVGSANGPPSIADSESMEKLQLLRAEKSRIHGLVEAEEERRDQSTAQFQQKNSARIETLTRYRLNSSDEEKQQADRALAECSILEREALDSEAVVRNLRARIAELSREEEPLKAAYLREKAMFLDSLYASLIERYNALAPEVADTILQIAASRRVMIASGLGNTNGWSGEVLLPGMKAKHGSRVPPILDGADQKFADAAESHVRTIYDRLTAAGFVHG